jgi:hypothetical protein
MDRLHFFFSFELSYLRTPRSLVWSGSEGFTVITPCHRHHHCAESSCVVLSRWSRHRNGSGRDWPHKATLRPLAQINAPIQAGSLQQNGESGLPEPAVVRV